MVNTPTVDNEEKSLNIDPVEKTLRAYAEERRVLVFSGFTGLGYEQPEELNTRIRDILGRELAAVGGDASKLLIVAGATSEGVGAVYSVAKEYGIDATGIVSEVGKDYVSGDLTLPAVIVPDPNGTGQVLDSDGKSYMVEVATYGSQGSKYIALGGGKVAVSELIQAEGRGVETEIYPGFKPDPVKVAAKGLADPTPVWTWVKNDPQATEGNNSIVFLSSKYGRPETDPVSAWQDLLEFDTVSIYSSKAKLPLVEQQSRFDSQIIIALENDGGVAKNVRSLFNKHPNTSTIIQLDAFGNIKLYGNPKNIRGKVRWRVVGHGSASSDTALEFGGVESAGGYTPKELASHLTEFKNNMMSELGVDASPDHINLVVCKAVDPSRFGGFAREFVEALDSNGLRPDVSSRNGLQAVFQDGRTGSKVNGKHLLKEEATDTLATFRMTDAGILVYRPNKIVDRPDAILETSPIANESDEAYADTIDAVAKYWSVRDQGAAVFDPQTRDALVSLYWRCDYALKEAPEGSSRANVLMTLMEQVADNIEALHYPFYAERPKAEEFVLFEHAMRRSNQEPKLLGANGTDSQTQEPLDFSESPLTFPELTDEDLAQALADVNKYTHKAELQDHELSGLLDLEDDIAERLAENANQPSTEELKKLTAAIGDQRASTARDPVQSGLGETGTSLAGTEGTGGQPVSSSHSDGSFQYTPDPNARAVDGLVNGNGGFGSGDHAVNPAHLGGEGEDTVVDPGSGHTIFDPERVGTRPEAHIIA